MKYVGPDSKRVVADVSPKEHRLIKAKAAKNGLTVKEVVRLLLADWMSGKIVLPEEK